ncbi:NADP-dependent oxidoreductase [Amaricoccus tamworthensis]|uniref:NADP-dependent oxidoreductase n=1 Tax=Amaricoccus tamworthensis TaxID=57002 RepID=UPI003C7CAD85
MPAETRKSWVLDSRPQGRPTLGNFRMEEQPLEEPGDGKFLVRTIWLSLDPYMRGRMNEGKSYAPRVELGEVMTAECVAEVISSKHPDYKVGEIVSGQFGWTTHAISDGEQVRRLDPEAAPLGSALGILGMPGITAWTSLNVLAEAMQGETIVVSAATGAVGTVLGQLAKLKKLRVIGVAGGKEKCEWAVENLGYDVCIDHHMAADELAEAIRAAAPNGVDIYHDNVGGKTLESVVPAMNDHGRIVVCGVIAWYNGEGIADAMPLPKVWSNILVKRLKVQGMIVFDYFDRYSEFLEEVAPLVKFGQLSWRETVVEGIENAPNAFLGLFDGRNFGKLLVRVGPDPSEAGN